MRSGHFPCLPVMDPGSCRNLSDPCTPQNTHINIQLQRVTQPEYLQNTQSTALQLSYRHLGGNPLRNVVSQSDKRGFPGGSEIKGSTCKAGDPGSIPGSGRSPGEGNGNPLQYSCLETPRTEEPGGLQSIGLQKSLTQLKWLSTEGLWGLPRWR